jgi:hypothetical protein
MPPVLPPKAELWQTAIPVAPGHPSCRFFLLKLLSKYMCVCVYMYVYILDDLCPYIPTFLGP